MNKYCKMFLAVAGAAICGVSVAQTTLHGVKAPDPITIQPVVKLDNNHVMFTGPKIPYHRDSGNFQRRVAATNVIFDGDEYDFSANQLGQVSNKYGEDLQVARFAGSATAVNAAHYIQYYHQSAAGQQGKLATGMSWSATVGVDSSDIFVWLHDGDTTVANGGTWDPNAPTVTTNPALPGVDFQYGPGGLTANQPGYFYYFSADLSTLGSGGLNMPSTVNGWYEFIIASAYDPTTNTITFAEPSGPVSWGTKPLNPSKFSDYSFNSVEFYDPTGTPTWTQITDAGNDLQVWGSASSYTTDRGTDVSATPGLASNLNNSGSPAVIRQKKQTSSAFNNAQITAVIAIPASAPSTASVRNIHPYLVMKANANPISSASMSISMLNNTTTNFDPCRLLVTSPPLATSTVVAASPYDPATAPVSPTDGLQMSDPASLQANYVAVDGSGNRSVTVRVGVKQLKPISTSWAMTINRLAVQFRSSPRPLGAPASFGTNL